MKRGASTILEVDVLLDVGFEDARDRREIWH